MSLRGKTFIHTVNFILGFEKPATQVTPKEMKLLVKYANNAVQAVEIGVFEGSTTRVLANCISKSGILYAIDPFFKGQFGLSWGKLIAKTYIKRGKLQNKVKFIRDFSFNAVSQVKENLDFIFIDGDHSYEGFKRDWEDWSVKVSKGGYIALHDTDIHPYLPESRPGSYKYFQSFVKFDSRFELVDSVDSLHVLKRI